MPAVLNRPGSSATRTYRVNSPALEALRRRLQDGIPNGTQKDLARRLGREDSWVYDQVEGKHPLGGDVIMGCLLAMPEGPRAVAIQEWLDGMVRFDNRLGLVAALRTIQEAVRAAEGLLDPGDQP